MYLFCYSYLYFFVYTFILVLISLFVSIYVYAQERKCSHYLFLYFDIHIYMSLKRYKDKQT